MDRARLLMPESPVGTQQQQHGSQRWQQHGKSQRRRALLVGINYLGTEAALQGCCNDVRKMQAFLTSQGWTSDSTRCLTDDPLPKQPHALPTKANMVAGIRWLVVGALPGDVLFFHFSGHGGQQVDYHGDEEDGMDETICPLDFTTAGQICDDDLFDLLVRPLPAGCRLTALLDCCHSGHGLDFPYTLLECDGHALPPYAWNCDPHVRHAAADVLLLSGCEDDECSADATCRLGQPAGAMTSAFLDVISHSAGRHTYPSLLAALQQLLAARGFGQSPQISSTHPFPLSRVVSLEDVASPGAPSGPVVHLPRPPNPRRDYPGGFGEMLGADASGYLAMACAAQAAHSHDGGLFGGIFGGGGGSTGSSFEAAQEPVRQDGRAKTIRGTGVEDEDDGEDEDEDEDEDDEEFDSEPGEGNDSDEYYGYGD